MSVRALVEAEIPRPTWAKQCLVALAVMAGIAGILTGLAMTGQPAIFTRQTLMRIRVLAIGLQGFSLGLFTALYMAGHFSTKGPPK
jgi:hypothetical protein